MQILTITLPIGSVVGIHEDTGAPLWGGSGPMFLERWPDVSGNRGPMFLEPVAQCSGISIQYVRRLNANRVI